MRYFWLGKERVWKGRREFCIESKGFCLGFSYLVGGSAGVWLVFLCFWEVVSFPLHYPILIFFDLLIWREDLYLKKK